LPRDLFFSSLFSTIAVVAILVITFYASKIITKKYSAKTGGKYIKIIDRAVLGQDKYIALVDICGKKCLISVCNNQINLLKDLEAIELEEIKTDPPQSFTEIFNGLIKDQFIKAKKLIKKGGTDE
jgi:flagellar protein FliO/FliZ